MTRFLQGDLSLPGDKSISHRALMFLALSKGTGTITNLSSGQDVMSTLACLQALGTPIESVGENTWRVTGQPHFVTPPVPLDCGNSGTTIRLMSGILAGANLPATLTGDASLCKRPMKRVLTPLQAMGAQVEALGEKGSAPLRMTPTPEGLHGITYPMPMASAQVKSAVLLAGLFTAPTEAVVVEESLPSRDHTERMLSALGCPVETSEEGRITLVGRRSDLVAQDIAVPGDISSAAFWLVGAAICPGSRLTLRQISLNPSRLGVLDALQQAGAEVSVSNVQISAGEPLADLHLTAGALTGDIDITPDLVPALIDEIPILTILGLFTQGTMTVRGAEELRFKESDRLQSLIDLLNILQVPVETFDDGFRFQAPGPDWVVPTVETPLETHHDHRLVMALEILNLRASHPLPVLGRDWVGISYPAFYQTL